MQLFESLSSAILRRKHSRQLSKSSNRNRQSSRRLRVESLENRNLMAGLVFDSVETIGYSDSFSTEVASVVHDQAGNSYTTGRFTGTIDFDSSEGVMERTAQGSHDAFVAKYDALGKILWVTQLGGDAINGTSGTDFGRDIALGNNGKIFVSGAFFGYTQIGQSAYTSIGGYDAFIAQLDASGAVLTSTQRGTAGSELQNRISTDSLGNAYFVVGRDNVNVTKFDSGLHEVWTKTIGDNNTQSYGSHADSAGNIYLTGSFYGTVDFDPGPRTKSLSGGVNWPTTFVMKIDSLGNYKWANAFANGYVDGIPGRSVGTSIATDSFGNVVVAGIYEGTVDFNPSNKVATLSGKGAYITKLSSSGSLVWAKALTVENPTEVANSVAPRGLFIDASNSIYVAGIFSGTVDLDPGLGLVTRSTADGNGDAFVLKLNPSGIFVWAETISGGPNLSESGNCISVSTDGVLLMAGSFIGDTDFDPDPLTSRLRTSGARSSGFVLRLRQI